METVALFAGLLSIVLYVSLGIGLGRRSKGIEDHLPLESGHLARVANPTEFSSSTVATTISLATVVMAFFELAGYFGVWLLWTVFTTAAGLFLLRFMARRIWQRMSAYGHHRPSLHEFLGNEYGAKPVALIGAACTSLGFLSALAVELTVGSTFLADLVPAVPSIVVIAVLAFTALTYTSLGGFRAVIVTDRIQMKAIWLLIGCLVAFYIYHFSTNNGWDVKFSRVQPETWTFTWREGLLGFLAGVFVINVPTFVSDMSSWQRIAGCETDKTVSSGMTRSVVGAAVTWTLFILLACLAPAIITPTQGINPLIQVLQAIAKAGGIIAAVLVFGSVLGLYGAMLSTASTQLIAASHAIHIDIIRRVWPVSDLSGDGDTRELAISRLIIIICAILSMVVVQMLSAAGFTIADLVFAIFGAQLGLFPPVILALFASREFLSSLARPATWAIAAGFVFGWGTAGFGKAVGDGNLVFLSPCVSLGVSTVILSIAAIKNRVIAPSAK